MSMGSRHGASQAPGNARYRALGVLGVALAVGLALAAEPALARRRAARRPTPCEATAQAQLDACRDEVGDDFSTAQAVCINVPDDERDECFDEARAERQESEQLCGEQRDARGDLCEALGGDRYDPDFDPADFDDDFANLTNPNPYFPLGTGSSWAYEGPGETIAVEVLDKTKRIEGVTCVVVHDLVEADGQAVEDTEDWIGQRKNGSVDYCGEIARNYESFPGDAPPEPELVDVEGSWKAGRDGALPGTLFQGAPLVGQVYRQEWSPGNAEDAARVLSTSYGFGEDPELDAFVPQALAELLCAAHDCVVTGEFTPIEPDVFERKYYAPGIGRFLEVDPESGDVIRLVDCNVDPKCAVLPAP